MIKLDEKNYNHLKNVYFKYFPDLNEPVIQIYPNRTTSEGETVILTCLIEGYPTVACKWLKNNVSLTDNCGDLRITNVTRLDTANYTCSAKNGFGTRISSPIYVDVYCK